MSEGSRKEEKRERRGRTCESFVGVVDGRVRVHAAEPEVLVEALARDVLHLHRGRGRELRELLQSLFPAHELSFSRPPPRRKPARAHERT